EFLGLWLSIWRGGRAEQLQAKLSRGVMYPDERDTCTQFGGRNYKIVLLWKYYVYDLAWVNSFLVT
uniref:Uncharacterized protein n=1 Tax=Aegilops tauschii subsp. strangulata TaxID=200361 RepID=A0A453CV41_AEGTS